MSAAVSRAPIDPRLLRHARSGRTGIGVSALIGAGQAAATVTLAVALARIVTGREAIGLLVTAFALRGALTWAEQVVAQRTAARVTGELRRSVLAATLRHGPAWVASYGSGRLTAVLTSGLDALKPWFSGYLPALVLGVALPPLVLVAMFLVDPASALIALVTLPLLPVLGALIGWATAARAQQAWQADARLAGHFLDVVRGLPTLRIFGRAARQTEVVRDMTDKHRTATVRVLRVAFLSSTALDLVGTLSVGLIAVEAGLRVANGSMGLGAALLVILLAPEAYRPLREMAARFHASADASAVIGDVNEVLTDDAFVSPVAFSAGRPGLYAARLSVSHGDRPVLDLPALAVRDHEIVALRGESGAGKTTTLRVLAGLQPLTAGRVELTGPGVLYLPQRPALPHTRTVADVFPGLSEAGVHAALTTVGLENELTPSTVLGEAGAGVSSGQRQRLALAALLRAAARQPAVLLLDEPTAHLDAASEQLVIDQLRAAAARGCAVLVVAHRPALLAAADRIVDVTPPEGATPPVEASALVTRADEGAELSTAAGCPQEVEREGASLPHTDQRGLPLGGRGGSTGDDVMTPAPGLATDATTLVAGRAADGTTPVAGRAADGTTPVAGRAADTIEAVARRPRRRPMVTPAAAVGLGAASSLAGIVLTGAAAWLLVRASSLPPVLTLSTAVVLVRGSAVARPLLRYLERLVAHDAAFARLGEWRARVYAGLIPRVPGPTMHRRGDLLTKVADDVDARTDGLLRGRLPLLTAAITLLVGTGVAVGVSPLLAVPLGAGLLISGVLAPALAAWQAGRVDAATGRARAELRDAVVETVDGIEELAGQDSPVPAQRSRALERLEARAARSAGTAAAVGVLGWGVAVAGTALVLLPAANAEWAAVLLLAVVALGEPIATLPDAAVARRRARGADERLAGIEQPPAVRASRIKTGDTRVRTLVAGWDPDQPPALHGLDLDIPRGTSVAILGPSGGGKSTLAAVLAGLLEPRAGDVTRPGRTILVGDAADHVFASTVRENLRLARPHATDGELRAALARVGLPTWDLDTWLGSGGSTISGGQRRRLATARALLADPELLILDEPTEGLDEAAAAALMSDLLAAARGRTVLLLTHRTEGLTEVSAILELRDGRLSPALVGA
ncbi:thiol reductant ABC exporter subunit CydC [Actinoplanes sp. RD1]|uniref:thiol reductant ABC exporter subunit CydC n=1 Tax=Actinoplanes sp. RD1 TaxID=3064538 RepID=UPI00274185A1|nr:thiol reductant ABC exporter subunit CydC [Actinoplanes sp. RD1]